MNSAQTLDNMIVNWKAEGRTRAELAVLIAEACLGWPYVWGSLGEPCTVANRERYMNRSAIGEGDRNLIRKRCQVLNGSRGSCAGCAYFPGGATTRIFDCRGFVRWVYGQCGIPINGAGATSQYNDNGNWLEKGDIANMPPGAVCCVFKHISTTGKMDHVGIHIGGGQIIHCSGEVKRGNTNEKGWTHYAIPKGLSDKVDDKPTLRKGSKGEWVTLLQTKLYQLGYSLGASGIDGKYGSATEKAVREFQLANGLTPDGITGQKTWSALDGTEPAIRYTVIIKGLTGSQADALIRQYPGSERSEERG